MDNHSEVSYKVAQRNLNIRIVNNLKALLESRELTPTLFMNQQKLDRFFSKQHFNRLFNHPENTPISAAVVALMCDFFGVSFENLISEKFDPKEYKKNDTEIHKTYLDIEKLGRTAKNKTIAKDKTPEFYFDFENNDTIEFSPKNRFFKGYFQKYYCYYFPTSSKENSDGKLLYGRLALSDAGNYCKATLKIDISGKYPEKESDFKCDKEYIGYTVISSSVRNVYCILFGNDPGDFCFISFRYMFLNQKDLYCRIAEVLASSSGNEPRRPTVLRMFISSTHIKREHIPLITSAIRLNYSKVTISQKSLDKLSQFSNEYKHIVGDLTETYKQENTLYMFDEKKDLKAKAEEYLSSTEEVLEFIARLRNLSSSYQYNKVSDSADDNIYNLLSEKGYYK